MHRKMQSHIGYICLTFLHCVVLNVSSNGLHERMHNHIGYICLTFPHCAISNVSSNCFSAMMHNYTGCICSTFLHCIFKCALNPLTEKHVEPHWWHFSDFSLLCVFMCGPSKHFHKWKHSCIDCICGTFHQCAFPCVLLCVLHWTLYSYIGCI